MFTHHVNYYYDVCTSSYSLLCINPLLFYINLLHQLYTNNHIYYDVYTSNYYTYLSPIKYLFDGYWCLYGLLVLWSVIGWCWMVSADWWMVAVVKSGLWWCEVISMNSKEFYPFWGFIFLIKNEWVIFSRYFLSILVSSPSGKFNLCFI